MKSKQARKAASEETVSKATPTIDNRRARFEYEIMDSVEAGIALSGSEIKSIRAGNVSLNEAFARYRDGEMWLVNMYIPLYKEASFSNHEPRRARKLLLHKEEIERLSGRVAEKGLTLVPLRMYFNRRGLAKISIGLAKGKKLWDKRRTIAERDAKRDTDREMRGA